MAMAMASDRVKPLAPSKVGILPRGESLRYSALALKVAALLASVLTNSKSRSLCLAATRMERVRPLSWEKLERDNDTRRRQITYRKTVELSEGHFEVRGGTMGE